MSLSNTATPIYYGQFRDAVLRGEIPVCREVAMEMNRIDDLLAEAELAEADFRTPQEKRKWAYENELSIIYRGEAITVDAANKQFMEYTAEGATEKCQELQQLIAAAKDVIRNTYPDETEV